MGLSRDRFLVGEAPGATSNLTLEGRRSAADGAEIPEAAALTSAGCLASLSGSTEVADTKEPAGLTSRDLSLQDRPGVSLLHLGEEGADDGAAEVGRPRLLEGARDGATLPLEGERDGA
mgnify:CR=1 FL=1